MKKGPTSPSSLFIGGMLFLAVAASLSVLGEILPIVGGARAGVSSPVRAFCSIALPGNTLMLLGGIQLRDLSTLVYVSLPLFMHLYALFLHGIDERYDLAFTAVCLAILFYHGLLKNALKKPASDGVAGNKKDD